MGFKEHSAKAGKPKRAWPTICSACAAINGKNRPRDLRRLRFRLPFWKLSRRRPLRKTRNARQPGLGPCSACFHHGAYGRSRCRPTTNFDFVFLPLDVPRPGAWLRIRNPSARTFRQHSGFRHIHFCAIRFLPHHADVFRAIRRKRKGNRNPVVRVGMDRSSPWRFYWGAPVPLSSEFPNHRHGRARRHRSCLHCRARVRHDVCAR